MQAAVRELGEELGWKISEAELTELITDNWTIKHKKALHTFIQIHIPKERKFEYNDEIDLMTWAELPFYDTLHKCLRLYQSLINDLFTEY